MAKDDADVADDALLAELLQELDLAVVEWLPDRTFRPFAPPPRWFKGMAQWSSLPFLEHFLPDAERHWLGDSGVLSSTPFTIDGTDGELLLRARALKLEGRLVMAIERLVGDADTRPVLRRAREQALAQEQLSENAQAVHAPAAALAQGLRELEQIGVSAAQRKIVDALASATERLQKAAARLPEPRKRRK
jgi:hypothetical protein